MSKDLRYFGSQTWPFPSNIMVGFRAEYGIIEAMNKEENRKRLAQIRRLEELLAYAIKHNEVVRIGIVFIFAFAHFTCDN